MAEPDAKVRDKLSDCNLDLISGGDERALYKWRLDFTPKFESKLLLINCRVPLDDWVKVFSRVVYCRGMFFGDPNYPAWKEYSDQNSTILIKNMPECEAYIADWWSLLGETAGK